MFVDGEGVTYPSRWYRYKGKEEDVDAGVGVVHYH